MKTRIISGVIAAVFAVIVLLGIYTPVVMPLLSILSAVAILEILTVIQLKSKLIKICSIVFAMFLPVYIELNLSFPLPILLALYTLVMLSLMLTQYQKAKFEQVAITIFVSIAIPLSFSSVLLIRDVYINFPDSYTKIQSYFFVWFVCACTWITDSCSYFAGRRFGKHKLAPNISPKKTIEGSVGGVIGSIFFNVIMLAVFNKFFFEEPLFSYMQLIFFTIILSISGMFGDLCASVLKRNYGVKDYGHIMPGHGGVMDRLDSFLFVIPTTYVLINIIEFFKI